MFWSLFKVLKRVFVETHVVHALLDNNLDSDR